MKNMIGDDVFKGAFYDQKNMTKKETGLFPLWLGNFFQRML